MPAQLRTHDLSSVPGTLLSWRVVHETPKADPRTLARWVSNSIIAADSTNDECRAYVESQLTEWHTLPTATRSAAQATTVDLLNAAGADFDAPRLHHHMGSIDGPLTIARCTNFAMPHFSKPAQAFWTCPALPGTGPIGFEELTGELNPDRRYEPYLLEFDSDTKTYLVHTVADWFTLIDRCGPDTTRTVAAPDFTQLPSTWAGVHVTTAALLRFAAAHARDPATPDLADWGMESTAWIRLKGNPLIKRVPKSD